MKYENDHKKIFFDDNDFFGFDILFGEEANNKVWFLLETYYGDPRKNPYIRREYFKLSLGNRIVRYFEEQTEPIGEFEFYKKNFDMFPFEQNGKVFSRIITEDEKKNALLNLINKDILKREKKDDGYVLSLNNDYENKIKNIIKKYDSYKYAIDEIVKYQEKYKITSSQDFINEIEKEEQIDDMDYNSSKIANNAKVLLNYMEKVNLLYSDIYSMGKRLDLLNCRLKEIIIPGYSGEQETSNFSSINEKQWIIIDIANAYKKYAAEVDNLSSQLESSENKINELKNKNIDVDLPPKPQKPEFNFQIPEQPEYVKPNLFNKKKVEKQNTELKVKYDHDLNEYEKQKKLYEDKLNKYNEEMNEYKILIDKIKKEAYDTQNKKIEEDNADTIKEINDLKEQITKKENSKNIIINDYVSKTDNYIQLKKIEYEIDYVERIIKNDFKILNQLLSYNIIYGKYRNMIAISSFIDYLKSGRCNTLDGPNGAYNLYEQESRADIIINKMDAIIDSLDNIKENQYYLYEQLTAINRSLDTIQDDLLVSNKLNAIQTLQLDSINNYTKETAYNTKVSAYYSKKISDYSEAQLFLKILDK